MPYKLRNLEGTDVTHHDLQDKGVWCLEGASKEEAFVQLYGEKLGLIINPQKAVSPYVPDLFNTSRKLLADLKTQNTPFFQASGRFGIDPQHAVVFNGKDRERYRTLYPDIEIYFAVDWQVVSFESAQSKITVHPMIGVWYIHFSELDAVLKEAPFHAYQQRISDDKGNAKGSYVISLTHPAFQQVI